MSILFRHLGEVDYLDTWQKMQEFTDQRGSESKDEIWFLQHPSIYTLGKNGKPEHILNQQDVPVANVDRGGQVTYHGPGQLVVYTLLDLKRLNLGVRQFVTLLEDCIVAVLAEYGVVSQAKRDAPGVYVKDAKIAALGLRVRRGCCFHGLALNVDMDLSPYNGINPCGYENLEITQLSQFVDVIDYQKLCSQLQQQLASRLSNQYE